MAPTPPGNAARHHAIRGCKVALAGATTQQTNMTSKETKQLKAERNQRIRDELFANEDFTDPKRKRRLAVIEDIMRKYNIYSKVTIYRIINTTNEHG